MLGSFGKSQQQLLRALLDNKSGLTTDELVKLLGVTRTAVYQHLRVLERDGYIMPSEMANTGGRPSQRYSLTDAGHQLFPKHYSLFSNLMLASLKKRLGDDGVLDYLNELGEQLAETFQSRLANKNGHDKLLEVVAIMQEVGYEASLDESADKPVIHARNCIYHSVAKQHHEICQLDVALVRSLLGKGDISLDECMAEGGGACRICVHSISTS
jgi:predicted ArsR family transcriptional regulator